MTAYVPKAKKPGTLRWSADQGQTSPASRWLAADCQLPDRHRDLPVGLFHARAACRTRWQGSAAQIFFQRNFLKPFKLIGPSGSRLEKNRFRFS
jgi:hypothetical protein